MIKINLIKKPGGNGPTKFPKEVMIALAAIVLLVALLAFFHLRMMAQKEDLAKRITSTEQEIALTINPRLRRPAKQKRSRKF
jgi:Na+/H+ antiporter NhaC